MVFLQALELGTLLVGQRLTHLKGMGDLLTVKLSITLDLRVLVQIVHIAPDIDRLERGDL